eukprot:GDKI01002386.1.p2 GENE.GDKI01002386.1~~GDKI01002386.1.p2  ORF type:complete len:146 (-),score=31.02 GDKI01002386.1:20-397(-)
MPELQGRLPIRCELKPLSQDDLARILTDTKFNLIKQQQALLATEGVELTFDPVAIQEVARIAYTLNAETANVGARRLKTVVSKLLEDLKFNAHTMGGQKVTVTVDMVKEKLSILQKKTDLSKYII